MNGINEKRMNMLYGVNQADQCWDFALGEKRDLIQQRLRDIDTRIVRLFLFDKAGPDPLKQWPIFSSYVNAVLNLGAVPMITFAKFRRPIDDPRAIRWFANQCADVVWGCLDQWGPEVVKKWYWCVWNEPNSTWIGGGLSFDQYRRIYEEVAQGMLQWLRPYLNGARPLIGGPAVEGFQPFWMDWVWRFANEIDNSLIGFVDWHRYGDWRNYGEAGAPNCPRVYRGLLMSQAPDYEYRARGIARALHGRNILNICGELNCHSHYETLVREHFNYTIFAAAYYVDSLLYLMRADVDAEMFWSGTEDYGGYGMMNKHGVPHPSYYAKTLCARYVRHGDWISFPTTDNPREDVDVVVSRGDDGQLSALFIHLKDGPADYELAAFDSRLVKCGHVLKIDEGTGPQIVSGCSNGRVCFNGYGVAVATNATSDQKPGSP
jgi:hypothetical protein